MDEEKILQRLKVYKGIITILIGLLFAAIGYSYTLRLDIDNLEEKVTDLKHEIVVIKDSYIRNLKEQLNSYISGE